MARVIIGQIFRLIIIPATGPRENNKNYYHQDNRRHYFVFSQPIVIFHIFMLELIIKTIVKTLVVMATIYFFLWITKDWSWQLVL